MIAFPLLFTPVSITPLIDTEDACFDLNASRPIAKGDLKWRDALLVAHRVNSNSFPFFVIYHNFTYLDISHIFIQNSKVRPKKENVYKYTLLTGKEVYKKMKILLAAVNAKYIHSNLAVYCLRAYAKEQHPASNITISEYTINQPFDEILMDIYKQAPDVLCLSCYLWECDRSRTIDTGDSKDSAGYEDLAWRSRKFLIMQEKFWKNIRWQKVSCAERVKRLLQSS